MRATNPLNRAAYFTIGALSFWGPFIALEVIAHRRESLISETLLPVGVLAIAYFSLLSVTRSNISKSLWMLVGIYVLGPVSTAIAATAFKGGFSQYSGWRSIAYLILFSLVPPLQLVDAAYVGAIFAMVIATIFLLLVGLFKEKLSGW